MRTARIIAPVAALVLTTVAGCWSPTIPKPKTEEDPLAGTEANPEQTPIRDTAPPPTDQSAPDMDAINAVADRLTRDAAKNCDNKQYQGPRESARVEIVFGPNGHAEDAKLSSPHAGTQIGTCIAQTFKTGIVPPFKGDPVTVERTVDFTKKAEPEAKEPEKKK